jgi:hypothetical protein
MQSIRTNYRNIPYLNTSFVVAHAKPNAFIFLVPSLYMKFYHFDLMQIHSHQYRSPMISTPTFEKPSPYHYRDMIECYQQHKSYEEYIIILEQKTDTMTRDDLLDIFEKDMTALDTREQMANQFCKEMEIQRPDIHMKIISVTAFIRSKYQDHVLFHSFNHPTGFLLRYVMQRVMHECIPVHVSRGWTELPAVREWDDDVEWDPMQHFFSGILHPVLSKVVRFDIPSTGYLHGLQVTRASLFECYFHHYRKRHIEFLL